MPAPSPHELRQEFLVDPEVAFLNHGSFGACPRPVFERYQAWQRELEREPVDFLDRRALPLRDPSELVDALFASARERTRVVFVSQVTSMTGLVVPVEEIVGRARGLGLVTVVDGAHAPAHVPVDLARLGADFYSGNCHKWLCAPKGAGFLHVQPKRQDRADAAIVSWGYREGRTFTQRIEMQGTRDPAAWLAVPDAIRFHAERDWDDVRERCRRLTRDARRELCGLLGTEPIAPDSMIAQMAAVRLPRPAPGLAERLFTSHRVEIPIDRHGEILRLSVAAYTSRDEVDRLLAALVRQLDPKDGQQDE